MGRPGDGLLVLELLAAEQKPSLLRHVSTAIIATRGTFPSGIFFFFFIRNFGSFSFRSKAADVSLIKGLPVSCFSCFEHQKSIYLRHVLAPKPLQTKLKLNFREQKIR